MAATAKRTDPALWERVKEEVTAGDRGGDPGEWSARKAQLAVQEYKKAGGGYEGRKSADNSLSKWTKEDWGTKSGEESGETGERYLPKAAREALTDEEYARTTAKKRRDTRAGRQHSAQPEDVARKTAPPRRRTGKAATPASGRKAAAPAKSPAKKAAPKRAAAAKAPAQRRASPAAKKAPARKSPARKGPAK